MGPPFHFPDPKSGCRPSSRPIDSIIASEFFFFGSSSTRLFQTLFFGKTGHFGAPGSRSAVTLAVAGTAINMHTHNIRTTRAGAVPVMDRPYRHQGDGRRPRARVLSRPT